MHVKLGKQCICKIMMYFVYCRLEKSFSGMYIGELVRLCLVKLIDNKALFNGKSSKKLDTRWSLNAKSVASIER